MRQKVTKGGLVAAALLIVAATAMSPKAGTAAAACTGPTPPTCIDADATYEDDGSLQSCRLEVEAFVDEANGHITCMQHELDGAADKLRETLDRFNCAADGNGSCL